VLPKLTRRIRLLELPALLPSRWAATRAMFETSPERCERKPLQARTWRSDGMRSVTRRHEVRNVITALR
jgi:hypothetical protein